MPPGAFRSDTLRALVVISDGSETAVALRDALPREMVVVLEARREEAAAAIAACRPYPWAIVADGPEAARAALSAGALPSIQLLRPLPADAPAHTFTWNRFSELVARVQSRLDARAGGMRLAPGMGVELAGGRIVRSAALQALVSMHPHGFALSATQFRSAARILAGCGSEWRPVHSRASGGIVLAPTRVTEDAA